LWQRRHGPHVFERLFGGGHVYSRLVSFKQVTGESIIFALSGRSCAVLRRRCGCARRASGPHYSVNQVMFAPKGTFSAMKVLATYCTYLHHVISKARGMRRREHRRNAWLFINVATNLISSQTTLVSSIPRLIWKEKYQCLYSWAICYVLLFCGNIFTGSVIQCT
jgi:hypothetical protein